MIGKEEGWGGGGGGGGGVVGKDVSSIFSKFFRLLKLVKNFFLVLKTS